MVGPGSGQSPCHEMLASTRGDRRGLQNRPESGACAHCPASSSPSHVVRAHPPTPRSPATQTRLNREFVSSVGLHRGRHHCLPRRCRQPHLASTAPMLRYARWRRLWGDPASEPVLQMTRKWRVGAKQWRLLQYLGLWTRWMRTAVAARVWRGMRWTCCWKCRGAGKRRTRARTRAPLHVFSTPSLGC